MANDDISLQRVRSLVGAELAELIDPGTLAQCAQEAHSGDLRLTAEELAVARALLFRVSGSALLDGDKQAIKDAGVIYRMVCTANNLLIGRVSKRGR